MSRPSSPLHAQSYPHSFWSTTNVGEAMPGVMTPLGWGVWGPAAELSARGAFVGIGALPAADGAIPADERDRYISCFLGRVAARVDFLGEMGDRLPGTTGPAVVEQFLGAVPLEMTFHPTKRRLPFVAVKLPYGFAVARRRMIAEHDRVATWWPTELDRTPGLDLPGAQRQFDAGNRRFAQATMLQANGMFMGVQPVYDQVLALVRKADAEHLLTALMGGGGSHAETEIVSDLWKVAQGSSSVQTFLERHGYHGPLEGEISGRVWREDLTPVHRLVEQYRGRDPEHSPDHLAARRRQEREDAERELLTALPAVRRGPARALLALARRNMPMRGIGKVTFLRSLDVARSAARRVGVLLADAGVLTDPEDVFLLTPGEVSGRLPSDVSDTVERRRAERAEYQLLELPTHWQGEPVPIVIDEQPAEQGAVRLTGAAGSGGVAEGVARVVTDPAFTDVEPDEIIVAPTTDPSWASIMFLCKALVVDIGGAMSHAAVVARELGIPCVVNTRTGTRDLRTGDTIRVDGSTGVVELLHRPDQVAQPITTS